MTTISSFSLHKGVTYESPSFRILYMILLVLLLSGPITWKPVEAILVVDDLLDLIDAIDLLREDWVGEGLYGIVRL